VNTIFDTVMAIKPDGTVFLYSFFTITSNWSPNLLAIKYPPNATVTDPLDPTLLILRGTVADNISQNGNQVQSIPYPPTGYDWYFSATDRNLQWDERRKLLYALQTEQPSVTSQDMYIWLVVTADNGHTWSRRFPVTNSHKRNRGYPSLAYDSKSETMIISFYDGRNSKTGDLQYMVQFFSKQELDEIARQSQC
jgi:hypothetical protein